MTPQKLEDRLIEFSVKIIKNSQPTSASFTFQHLSRQLIRSATSAALNYGESRSAESEKDFIHKLHVSLKELRECLVNLKILLRANILDHRSVVVNLMQECDQLISILVSTVRTIQRKSA
jgi:four helix bundle protein